MFVSSVIDENPFECTAHITDGQSHAPIEKANEIYTTRFVYEDANANIVGTNEIDFNTVSGFNSSIAIIMANTSLATAYGGICIHDPDEDTYYVALQCHDANGELYYLALRRDSVTLDAYSDAAIQSRFETGSDKLAPLAHAGSKTSHNPSSLKTDFTLHHIA